MTTATTKPTTPARDPHTIPTGLVWVRQQTARQLIHSAFRVAGMPQQFPITTRVVLGLCRVCGYRVDPQTVSYLLGNDRIPTPDKDGNGYAWTLSDCVALIDALEELRRWEPGHPVHAHKLTGKEKREAVAHQAMKDHAVSAFLKLPPDQLLSVLVESDDREERVLACIAARQMFGVDANSRGDAAPEPSPASLN